ncbi:MAG: hypothetical protein BJ554DRAFT_3236 [Olpidium bornovanus]|uniref:Uncharacterized protein n=1 Tax=Olpidium bornovanus TaxID=278681 RepID=A0A8H8A0T5_9FUNG|nr:MAG: hypothetical protein BJ554DRAFT_3236 [Olpidium bornovanus]
MNPILFSGVGSGRLKVVLSCGRDSKRANGRRKRANGRRWENRLTLQGAANAARVVPSGTLDPNHGAGHGEKDGDTFLMVPHNHQKGTDNSVMNAFRGAHNEVIGADNLPPSSTAHSPPPLRRQQLARLHSLFLHSSVRHARFRAPFHITHQQICTNPHRPPPPLLQEHVSISRSSDTLPARALPGHSEVVGTSWHGVAAAPAPR